MIDLHIHTPRCGHAEGAPEAYVAAARAAGIATMAFTDHLPLPPGYPQGYSMGWPEMPGYVEEVRSLSAAAQAEGGPEILLGVEADWIPGHEALVRGALEEHAFDLVLGSVHFIDDWAFDDPDLRERYSAWTPDLLWERYFDDVCAAAFSRMFDVMAHADLIKKFGCVPMGDPGPYYRAAAAAFAESGVAIEVNTAGLRKPCAEIYPSAEFLKECRMAGVPATVGSDAHRPEDVGAAWTGARELLLAAGYASVVVFRSRSAEEVGL